MWRWFLNRFFQLEYFQIKKKDDEIKEHQMMVEERDVRLKKIQKKFEKQAETLSMITKLSNNIQDSQ